MSSEEDSAEVIEIAAVVADAEEHQIPSSLVKLKGLVEKYPVGSQQLRNIRKSIWKYDLLSWCAIALGYDYTKQRDGFETAAKIAHVFSDGCRHVNVNVTDSPEFATNSLPAAACGLLHVARQLQQRIVDQLPTPRSQTRTDAELCGELLDVALELVTSYPRHVCACAVESRHLLRLMMEDEVEHEVALRAIGLAHRAVHLHKDCVRDLKPGTLQALLDELVYKLTSSSNCDVMRASTRLILRMAGQHPPVAQLMVARFKGLKAIMSRWEGRGVDHEMRMLITLLDTGSAESVELNRKKDAACLIWAYYQGWKVRARMRKLRAAVPRLQRDFRRKRRARDEAERAGRSRDARSTERDESARRSFRRQMQRQMHALEIVPADKLPGHLHAERVSAAVLVQAHWRAFAERKRLHLRKQRAREQRAAVVIQRSTRDFLGRKAAQREKRKGDDVRDDDVIGGERRKQLKNEILKWQAVHKRLGVSRDEVNERHVRAQEMMLEYVVASGEERAHTHAVEAVLARVHTQQLIFQQLPPVAVASREDANKLASTSNAVRMAARQLHQHEIKLRALPWWRKLSSRDRDDDDDLDLTSFDLSPRAVT